MTPEPEIPLDVLVGTVLRLVDNDDGMIVSVVDQMHQSLLQI